MKKIVTVIRVICFLVILGVLFFFVTEILKDKRVEGEYNVTTKVKGFYAEPDDSLDFVFVGSSQMYADIAPAVLWNEYGITSYDFCANEQPLWISYYYIKEALKHQKPKAIVLDVFTVYGEDYEAEGVNHINLDDLPWSMNKVNAIRNSVPEELQYSFFFEIAKYHSTWSTFYDEKYTSTFGDHKDIWKGYSPFVFAREYKDIAPAEVIAMKECQPIPEKSEEWLKKIVELTREEGVDLILIKTPNGNAERQKLYNSVSQLAEDENVPFLNMNQMFDGEAHINVIQAEKVTAWLGKYLAENYEVTDKRGEPGYAEWDESAAYFERYRLKCMLANADTYAEYMQVIEQGNYIAAIAARNTAGDYVELRQGGEVIAENKETDSPTIVKNLDHLSVNLSVSRESGEPVASLLMNEIDYSVNCDGINIAVYDPVLGEMVEMAGFDAKNGNLIIRK